VGSNKVVTPGTQYLRLTDFPKEEAIAALKTLIECGALQLEDSEGVSVDLTHLTDGQLYELITQPEL